VLYSLSCSLAATLGSPPSYFLEVYSGGWGFFYSFFLFVVFFVRVLLERHLKACLMKRLSWPLCLFPRYNFDDGKKVFSLRAFPVIRESAPGDVRAGAVTFPAFPS